MAEQESRRSIKLVFQPYRIGQELESADEQRRQELDSLAGTRGLSREETIELNSLVRAQGFRGMVEGPEFEKLGVADPDTFMENFWFLIERTESSYEAGYWFEALSLRLLELDLMLRIFIVHKTKKPIAPHSTEDKLSLGALIKKAKKHGLPQELAQDLWTFNKRRNDNVHHFLKGRATYQEVGDAYRYADGLLERVIAAADLPPLQVQ